MKNKMKREDVILINILINIWEKKLIIFLTSLLFLIVAYTLINISKKPPQYNISTNIKPLSFSKENKYTVFNEFIKMSMTNDIFNNFVLNTNKKNFEITDDVLYKMFVDNLENKKIIIDAIKKLNIIDRNEYEDISSFNYAVQELAYSITIYNPDKKNRDNNKKEIRVQFYDFTKWENLLNLLESEINNKVREILINQFEAYVDNLVKLNKYLVSDLEKQISFYETKLRNLKRNNLTHLYGHAQVAREMGIKNISKDINFLIVDNFDPGIGDDKLMLDFKNPRYYLMGYEFIERRIDLIEKSLENKTLISNDAVILDNNRKLLLNREIIETINDLFNKSPLMNPIEFSAASFDVKNSNMSVIQNRFSNNKILFFAFILGLLVSVVFVLISKNINRNVKYFLKELKNKQREI